MKKTILIAALLALGTGGCAIRVGPPESVKVGDETFTLSGLDGFNAAMVKQPDPNNPNVFVTATRAIVIDQEPIRPKPVPGGNSVRIAWALEAQSEYTFPDNAAITLMAGPDDPLPRELACAAIPPKKKVFVCKYVKPGRLAKWKYTIRVADRTGAEIARLDPWVFQD